MAKEIFCIRSKSSANELKQTSNKMRLYNSNTFKKSNGIDKRNNDGKHDVCMFINYSITCSQFSFMYLFEFVRLFLYRCTYC